MRCWRTCKPVCKVRSTAWLIDTLWGKAFFRRAFHSNNGKTVHDLANRINRVGRDAFALLEKWELAEPADDMNGRNGYVVLTDKGKSATERTDFERIRVRGLLREEMLHLRLQGQIYGVLRLTILAPPYSKRSRLWKSNARRRRLPRKGDRKNADVQGFCARGTTGQGER